MTSDEITLPELRRWLHDLRELIDERDKRYEQKFASIEKTFENAMLAAEKQVAIAAAASEKAITKAQEAQSVYDDAHNNLVRNSVPKPEYDSKMKDISAKEAEQDKAIQSLGDSRSQDTGSAVKGSSDQARNQWIIMVVIGVVTFALGILANHIK